MGRVTAGWHISDSDESTKSIIIKRVGGQEILVLVVSSRGPEVTDLLGFDASVDLVWRASKGRSRNLQNRQRRSVLGKRLSDSRDEWN